MIREKLSTNELKLLILKASTVAIGFIFGFIQPAIFIRTLGENELSYVLLITGLATYLVFFDFGISKPAYARLRQRFLDKKRLTKDVSLLSFAVLIMLLVTSIVFTTITMYNFYTYGNYKLNPLAIIFFSITLSMTVGFNNLKIPLLASENFIYCQKVEIFKSITFYSAAFFLFYDNTFTLTSIVMLSSSIFSIYLIYYKNNYYFKSSMFSLLMPSTILSSINKLKVLYFLNSTSYLVFSACEAFIYNASYILIPILFDNKELITFSLWMKLFLGGILISKIISETFIHRLTRNFHSQKNDTVEVFLKLSFFCLLVAILLSLTLTIFGKELLAIWTAGKYSLNGYYVLAFWFFSIGNAIQNLSGTILLSINGYFSLMRKVSILIAIISLAVYIVGAIFNINYPLVFFLSSIIYFCGSISYYVNCMRVIKNVNPI
ncbi:hypothetical protein GKR71_07790 [Providencia sp. wls1922]|uniref:hypothetical protein n=1 Tax=Providencia sp. wls1922 TaxID=2675152 RepID=UPI0012B54C04|nr:hypothetical protein [Providencia sp. wls1922]MTC45751.1 hypothetical protein [Providencia sp. wls1922]